MTDKPTKIGDETEVGKLTLFHWPDDGPRYEHTHPIYVYHLHDEYRERMEATQNIQIRFDGPPSHESGRFIEVEDATGKSIRVGDWVKDGDYWLLRLFIPKARLEAAEELAKALRIIAGGFGAPEINAAATEQPVRWRSNMWTWSQQVAKAALAKWKEQQP